LQNEFDNNFDYRVEKPRRKNNLEKTETKTLMQNISEDNAIVTLDEAVDIAEVDAKIEEYVKKNSDGTFSCGRCGKQGVKNKGDIKRHVETHVGGLSFPCHSCDKTFRTRNALRLHKSKYHQQH